MCSKRPCKCSCDLVAVDSSYEAVANGPVGAFGFRQLRDGDVSYLELRVKLPNEGGQYHGLPVYLESEPHPPNRAAWQWDGNRERPTLKPSIATRLVRRDVRESDREPPYTDAEMEESWHGHITEGRAVSCA